jgi:hypothetical protein
VRYATTPPNSCTVKTNTEAEAGSYTTEADSCTAQAHAKAKADSCTAEADSCPPETEADSCTAEAEADSCAAEAYTCWVQDQGGGLFVVCPVLSRASLHRRAYGSNHLPLDAHNETCYRQGRFGFVFRFPTAISGLRHFLS